MPDITPPPTPEDATTATGKGSKKTSKKTSKRRGPKKKPLKKAPRQQRVPGTFDDTDPELVNLAIQHEDLEHTIAQYKSDLKACRATIRAKLKDLKKDRWCDGEYFLSQDDATPKISGGTVEQKD